MHMAEQMTNLADRKLLIIDDDALVRQSIVTYLRDSGFLVSDTGDAQAALALLQDADHLPHLVITDLRMPEESGIGLIKRLRDHTARQHLPVIVMSGHADMEDISDLLRLQVLDLFRKPIYHARLLETLENLFPKPRMQVVC